MFWWPDCTSDQINQTSGVGQRHQNFKNFPRQFQLAGKFTTTALDWCLSLREKSPGACWATDSWFQPQKVWFRSPGWGWGRLCISNKPQRCWCCSPRNICLRSKSEMHTWTQNQWGGVVFCRGRGAVVTCPWKNSPNLSKPSIPAVSACWYFTKSKFYHL